MGGARRTASSDVARPAAADGRADFFSEGLYRPADLLVHRLSAQREGFFDRTAPMGSEELPRLSRAGAEFDPSKILTAVVPAYALGHAHIRCDGLTQVRDRGFQNRMSR